MAEQSTRLTVSIRHRILCAVRKVVAPAVAVLTLALLFLTFAGYFGTHARLLDRASHFKAQWLLGAVLLLPLVGFLLRDKVRWICLALLAVAIAVNTWEILPWYAAEVRDAPSVALEPIRVAVVNVLRRNKQYDRTLSCIREIGPDILVVQEADGRWLGKLEGLEDVLPYRFASRKTGGKGIALFSRWALADKEECLLSNFERPNLKATIDLGGIRVQLLASHPCSPTSKAGKWEDRNLHLSNIAKFARETTGPLLVIGDLNTSMWSAHYKCLAKEGGLRNVRKGFGLVPTWPAPLAVAIGIPIDHILHSRHFATQACGRGSHIGSDHLPLWADLGLVGE